MRALPLALAATLALAGAGLHGPAHAADHTVDQSIDSILGDHVTFKRVILATRAAIKSHRPPDLAALVRYPIDVAIGGRKRLVRTPAEFVANYDAIVTPAITEAVLAENYEDLFVNQSGVMFGRGEVWIGATCLDNSCKRLDVKITTIQPALPVRPPP